MLVVPRYTRFAAICSTCSTNSKSAMVLEPFAERSLARQLRDLLGQTIQGYEAMNKIRKGQIRWLAKGDVVEQVRFINQTFGIAA